MTDSAADGAPTLGNWTPGCSREPIVRVGVVLETDARHDLQIELPAVPHAIVPADGPGERAAGGRFSARLVDGRVALQSAGGPPRASTRWRITPAEPTGPRRDAGVTVGGVTAGRGFHWEKRVDQHLPGTIELLPGTGGLVLVNELSLEGYLAGVITAEMGGACPSALLEAQCVVARSWLLAFTEPKHTGDPFERCNDDCCQRYQGTGDLTDAALSAVRSTRGLVLMAGGGVVDANYSKCCGGIVEAPEHVWGGSKPGLEPLVDAPPGSSAEPFLPVTDENLDEFLSGGWVGATDVYCSPNAVPAGRMHEYLGRVDDAGAEYFRWTRDVDLSVLLERLRSRAEGARLCRILDVRVVARGISGRAKTLEIEGLTSDGGHRTLRIESEYRIRDILDPSFLYSSAFAIQVVRDSDRRLVSLTLSGAGWGHGAGMCQIGALGMALAGIPYAGIIGHYFPGAALQRLYD